MPKNYFISFLIIMGLFFILNDLHAEVHLQKSKAVITFTLIKNDEAEKNFAAEIKITNLPRRIRETTWEVAFNSIRSIVAITSGNASLVSRKSKAGFYIIKFKLNPNETAIKFTLQGQSHVQHDTDTPQGYFLIELTGNSNQPKEVVYSVGKSHSILPTSLEKTAQQTQPPFDKFNTAIENNSVDTTLTADETRIVPLPVEISRHLHEKDFIINENTRILYYPDQNKITKKAAHFFQRFLREGIGYPLKIQSATHKSHSTHNIILTTQHTSTALNKKQSEEGYVIEVRSNRISVSALSERGFFYALQSIKQLLPPEIYAHVKPSSKIQWKIPAMRIVDYPRFPYRGLLLDSARHFFQPRQVKRLLDLMSIHKLNYFHWHLTDDEGWRLEIKKYPQLTKIGGYRGYNPNSQNANYLFPAYGSGPAPYGGYYSQQEIREIVKFAKDRFITIIPEIDMPSHARAMIMSMPDKLADHSNEEYKSAQGYTDNVLSPCQENTYIIIDNIIKEVVDLFPGKYIHIGGDEVPDGVWKKSIACKHLPFDSTDPDFKNKLQNYFLLRLQKIIRNHGKIMAGWEEIASEVSSLSPPLLVYIWNNRNIDQVYNKSKNRGYDVIMSPAKNLYFDLAYSADRTEPGLYWAGYVDTFSAYSFKPIENDKGQSADVIKGVQGQLWSENINSSSRLDYLAFPKVSGLAELAWTPAHRRNWKNFYERMRFFHLKRLDNYGVGYRKNEFK